jgi:Zn finger protein HypA/HybF involved in hydrogenase expression
MTGNLFHCMKCGKNRTAKRMQTVLKPGKDAGVSMHFYQARCPVCGSRMMKIANIVRVTKKRR